MTQPYGPNTHVFFNQLDRLDGDTINQHGHITWHDIKCDITVNDIFITIHQKAGPSEPRYKGEQSTAWASRPNRSLHDAQIPFQLGMFPVGGIPTGTPLKNMTSSVGMMTFPIYGKIIHMFETTNQYISNYAFLSAGNVSVPSWNS